MSEAILRTKLTGDSAELQRALREGMDSAKKFGSEMGRQMREVALQISGVVLGVESIKAALEKTYEGVKGVFDLSRDLRNLSNQTGTSVRDLVQLRAEFDLSGIAADHVGAVLNRMQRSIETAGDKGGESAELFYRLGLNIRELQQMNPAEQFDVLRQRLTAIEDPARRAQLAMKIFGNFGGGGSTLAIFGNAKIAEAASEAISRQANILAENAKTFQEVSINMELAGIRIEGFFVGMADPIGDVILPVLKELNSIDLTRWGDKIGGGIADAVRILYNAFDQGGLGDVLDTAFQAVVTSFASAFTDALIGSAEAFGAEMLKVMAAPILWGQAAIAFRTAQAAETGQASSLMKQAADADKEGWTHRNIARALEKNDPGYAEYVKRAEDAEKEGWRHRDMARALKENDPIKSGYEDILADSFFSKAKDARDKSLKSNEGIDREDRMADGFFAAAKDARDQISGLATERNQDEWMANYVKENKATFFGKDSESLTASAQAHLDKAGSEFGMPIADALAKLEGKYGGKIPGEGTPNDPSSTPKPSFTPDFGYGHGSKQFTGIGMGAGGWQGINAWSAGPLNIQSGMTGRAGRIVDQPHTVEQNTSDMKQSLSNIDKILSNVMMPA